ncbi:MAG: HU family DNA-binding protein [Bacteroidaceae bacterium]|nr:HU family DNA-binding protein [Bacteroidaceae bacterium]MBO7557879.1 HU family DNA-binding protein [Bacteroidaceae bacterium]
MNKGELVKAVAENAGLTLAQAKAAVDAAINSVSAALKAGDKVTIPGIATLSVEERAARTGINPQTKEKIQIPAKKVVKFKAGSQLI